MALYSNDCTVHDLLIIIRTHIFLLDFIYEGNVDKTSSDCLSTTCMMHGNIYFAVSINFKNSLFFFYSIFGDKIILIFQQLSLENGLQVCYLLKK